MEMIIGQEDGLNINYEIQEFKKQSYEFHTDIETIITINVVI